MSKTSKKTISSLKDHFLVAMPGLHDDNFSGSVVYICEHNVEGAMGLIINQQLDIPAKAVFDRLELKYNQQEGDELIFDGGPIQQDRGFILHSDSGQKWESTIHIGTDISLTTSKDILGDIALGAGPKDALITLGYSSWGGGQLEEELKDNSWLVIPADSAVLFKTDCAQRAQAAALTIGLNLDMLALESGHA
ncbi:YqgE/AlgH family protein [Porticoccaceae bacterium]|jgi:putative transcriptional regulator|nr:YqgE/AlgH family protein [Cellvibrionales bacterium]MDB3925860.1 YqgE/AlgH family protein [Porticoccaceae bacterium]